MENTVIFRLALAILIAMLHIGEAMEKDGATQNNIVVGIKM